MNQGRACGRHRLACSRGRVVLVVLDDLALRISSSSDAGTVTVTSDVDLDSLLDRGLLRLITRHQRRHSAYGAKHQAQSPGDLPEARTQFVSATCSQTSGLRRMAPMSESLARAPAWRRPDPLLGRR